MIINVIPYNILFMSSLIMSIMLTLNSNSWIMLWTGLELNMLSFIPLMSSTSANMEMEATVKYFLIQAVGSALLLFSSLMMYSQHPILLNLLIPLLLTSLLLKLGMAPCHFWFPQVMNSISWNNCLILATLQKMNPLMILISIPSFWSLYLVFLLIFLNSSVGGLGGINQTQMRAILSYSSIAHLSWILGVASYSLYMGVMYFLFYLMISLGIFMLLIKMLKLSTTQFNITFQIPMFMNILMFINLLSLAGMPPLIGFLPKWLVIDKLFSMNPAIIMMLVTSSLFSLFYYLTMFFSSTVNNMKSYKLNYFLSSSNIFWMSSMSPVFLFWIMISYAMNIFDKS